MYWNLVVLKKARKINKLRSLVFYKPWVQGLFLPPPPLHIRVSSPTFVFHVSVVLLVLVHVVVHNLGPAVGELNLQYNTVMYV